MLKKQDYYIKVVVFKEWANFLENSYLFFNELSVTSHPLNAPDAIGWIGLYSILYILTTT